MGKSTINGPFSIAMLVYQRVVHWHVWPAVIIPICGPPGLKSWPSDPVPPMCTQRCTQRFIIIFPYEIAIILGIFHLQTHPDLIKLLARYPTSIPSIPTISNPLASFWFYADYSMLIPFLFRIYHHIHIHRVVIYHAHINIHEIPFESH